MQTASFLFVAALVCACLFSATAVKETIEYAENCDVSGDAGKINIWHVKDSGKKKPVLLLSEDGTITDHVRAEALRMVRMGYTVAAMNVFSASKGDMASLEGAAMALDYAVQIKGGVDFMLGADYAAWVDGTKVTVMGWGFGANGVLAAASHPALAPMLMAGVAYTPDLAANMRANLNVTHATPELLVAVDYAQIDHLEPFETNMDAGNVKWEINVMSDTMKHFNVAGNDNFKAEATRRMLITTKNFLDQVVGGAAKGSQKPARAVSGTMMERHLNYSVNANVSYPGVAIWDSAKATAAMKKPAFIVIPAWSGYTEYEVLHQIQAAEEGYVTMSANIYGLPIGQALATNQGAYAGTYRGSNELNAENEAKGALFNSRVQAAVDAVKTLDNVDQDKIAVLGFCFGGTGVYNVFRYGDGDDVKVGISMQGSMRYTRDLSQVSNLPGEYMLMVSGGEDGGESGTDLKNHLADLTSAAPDLDWEVMRYSSVLHGFSEWDGGRYNADAEGRGTKAMMDVLADQWDMDTADTGCTAGNLCTCPESAPADCEATEVTGGCSASGGSDGDDDDEDADDDSGSDSDAVPPSSWACGVAAGTMVQKCFEVVIGAAPEVEEVCTLVDTVKPNVADCFVVHGCCDDWAAWVEFWKADLGASACDFGACAEVAHKVEMTARLQYSKSDFDDDVDGVQTKYIKACAAAAGDGVSVADVVISGTTAVTVRRRLLADAVDVATQIRVASAEAATSLASSLTLDKLNTALEAEQLSVATLVAAPEVKAIVGDTDAAARSAPSLLVALGAVLAAMQLLFY